MADAEVFRSVRRTSGGLVAAHGTSSGIVDSAIHFGWDDNVVTDTIEIAVNLMAFGPSTTFIRAAFEFVFGFVFGVATEPRTGVELFANRIILVGADLIKDFADDCLTGVVGFTIRGVDSTGGQRRKESKTRE